MSADNVVALPGFTVPTPKGQPVTSVVEILREYLVKAEAGNVTAVAIAVVMDDGTESPLIDVDFAAAAGRAWALNASVGRLNRRLAVWLDE